MANSSHIAVCAVNSVIEGGLAAGDAHVTADRGFVVAPVDHEVMAFRFARDGLLNGRAQQVVAFAGPQRRA